MPFDEVLARCIADIEAGASVEECLARHPHDAANLESLLRLMEQLQQAPKPTLSATGFARGRAAVAAQARYHERLHASFLPQSPAPHLSPSPLPARQLVPPRAPAQPPTLFRWSNWMAAFLLVLTTFTLGRTVNSSAPGMMLYPIKLTVEQFQGYLFTAAGQEERWRIRQIERRLAELDQLARQGQDDAALLAVIDQEVQAALEASNGLSANERVTFFDHWMGNLQSTAVNTDHTTTTVVTLGRVLATVEAAASGPVEPTVLPLLITPTASPTATASPTVPTATPQPPADEPAELVQLPTVTPTTLLIEALPPTATSTPSPVATPTTPPTTTPTQQPVHEDDDRDEDRPRATDTPTQTQTPLPTATPIPTATWTPIRETATPTGTPIEVTPTTTEEASVTPTAVTGTPTVDPQTPTPATPVVSVTSTPVETETGEPSATPETATPEETVTPRATETVVSETPEPPVTPTPEETPTSEPSPTEPGDDDDGDDDDDDDDNDEDEPAEEPTPTVLPAEHLRLMPPVMVPSATASRN